jgi:hypothetical protein
MKLLFSSRFEDVDAVKAMLDGAGIGCEVTNDTTPYAGAEFYPELWIVDDAQFERASVLLENYRKAPTPKVGPWICPRCGEQLEGQFLSCWKCGATRNDVA